ncbi:MAG: type II toxin-antitoxin system antitoxin SocA domain-containing protein [Acidobacteriota bacterium]
MASVHDIAAFILKEHGEMTAMKLQKLVYYAQAWSLVWDEAPLFPENIEAWANGPVIPALYQLHRGQFRVSEWPSGDPSTLTKKERETVRAVLKFYGHRPSQWLSDLTHSETPWLRARKGLAPGERGSRRISHASLAEYYGGLAKS